MPEGAAPPSLQRRPTRVHQWARGPGTVAPSKSLFRGPYPQHNPRPTFPNICSMGPRLGGGAVVPHPCSVVLGRSAQPSLHHGAWRGAAPRDRRSATQPPCSTSVLAALGLGHQRISAAWLLAGKSDQSTTVPMNKGLNTRGKSSNLVRSQCAVLFSISFFNSSPTLLQGRRCSSNSHLSSQMCPTHLLHPPLRRCEVRNTAQLRRIEGRHLEHKDHNAQRRHALRRCTIRAASKSM